VAAIIPTSPNQTSTATHPLRPQLQRETAAGLIAVEIVAGALAVVAADGVVVARDAVAMAAVAAGHGAEALATDLHGLTQISK